MATQPETFRITHVSSNGIGVVVSSNASFLVPFAKKYGVERREGVVYRQTGDTKKI